MKAKRFLSMLLMGCLTVLTLFSFVGCGENGAEEDLKKQIAELKTQVQTLEADFANEKVKSSAYYQLVKQNQMRMEALMNGTREDTGLIVSLSDAYYLNFLTKEDLRSIAYYRNGGNRYNEELIEVNFVPSKKTPITLTAEQERKILESHAFALLNMYPNSRAEDFKVKEYLGCYNGYYVVILNEPPYFEYVEAPASLINVGGICFKSFCEDFMVWKEN